MSTDLQAKDSGNLPITDPGLTDAARAENSKKTILAGDTTGATNIAPTQSPPLKPSLADGSKKTWGEKVYNTVVYQVFGFGINLGVSSLLTYWVKHSQQKVWQGKTPEGISESLKNWFANSILTGSKSTPVEDPNKQGRAQAMANATILTLGGHIMIPIIKLFENNKTGIITSLDSYHYGKEGTKNPEISAAHERIANEIRPTWFSTILARVGSMLAVQGSARLFGADNNFISKAGKDYNIPLIKSYPGIESGTGNAGRVVAESFAIPQGLRKRVDASLVKLTANPAQLKDVNLKGETIDISQTGKLFKYGFSDVIYTLITAASIKPMNNWLIRNFSFLRKEPETAPAPVKPHIRSAGLYSDETLETKEQPSVTDGTPSKNISHLTHDGLLTSAPALQKA